MTTHHKLDNPVWYSLSEVHQPVAIACEGIKCYHPDYGPFGGYLDINQTARGIDVYAKRIQDFFMVGEKPRYNSAVQLQKELVCLQMVLDTKIALPITETITTLEAQHAAALHTLVNRVQPGYFKSNTWQLGSYYGIFKNNELVAVAGERMKMHAFTEVSAVVTHPAHTGKGYAKQLVSFASNSIFREGKVPYLHVAETNTAAIKLYEKLSYKTRRKISFWNFVANDGTKENIG